MRYLNALLCFISRRWKFRQICRALQIKPYPWQRDFAMRKCVPVDKLLGGRCNGKTMAVMLRLLMVNPAGTPTHELWQIEFQFDKDFKNDPRVVRWYRSEYYRCAQLCVDRGIPVQYYNIRILN